MKVFYENRKCRENIFLSHSLTFNAHMHEEVEIVYMIEGTAHAFSGGVECNLSPGDFFIAFPNHIHYYDNCQDNVAVVAIIPLKVLSEFRGILTTKSPLSPHIKNADPLAGKLFESALLYKGKYKNEAEKGLLLSAVSALMEKVSFTNESVPLQNALPSILTYCENNYLEDISLDKVSKSLGISKSHISHIFSEKLHMNFRDYINSLRLNYATELLAEEKRSMTEIAVESGFDTIRTFNRAFRKRFNASPLEYRKQNSLSIDKK